MRLLLDTHVLLALMENRTGEFPPHVRQLLVQKVANFHVSVASLWEIAIKSRLGKLHVSLPLPSLPSLVDRLGAELIIIDEHHVLANIQPEAPTRDPFDRLLLAQCQVEGMRLVTIDRALVSHPLAAI
jgi:PIN domain nuclease of toxin-antitoxin system